MLTPMVALAQAHSPGSARDWGFAAQPNPRLNGRALSMSMGKMLARGSRINVMYRSRVHKNDWDYFAAEAGDDVWGYAGGTQNLPAEPGLLDATRSAGRPLFDDQNGRLMEGAGGRAIVVRIFNGKRPSFFRTYLYSIMDRPNIAVLTGALVTPWLSVGIGRLASSQLPDDREYARQPAPAPSVTNRRTMARPMPLSPPVTRAFP